MFEDRYPQFKGKVVVELLPLCPWDSSTESGKKIAPGLFH